MKKALFVLLVVSISSVGASESLDRSWEYFKEQYGDESNVRQCVESRGTRGECSGLWQEAKSIYEEKKEEVMDKWGLKDPEKFCFEFEYYDFCGKMYRTDSQTVDPEKDSPIKKLHRRTSYDTLKQEVTRLGNLKRRAETISHIGEEARSVRESDRSLREQRFEWLDQAVIPSLKAEAETQAALVEKAIKDADPLNRIVSFYGPIYSDDCILSVSVPETEIYARAYSQSRDPVTSDRMAFLWLFAQMKEDCINEREHPINAHRDQRSTCLKWIETTEQFASGVKHRRGLTIDTSNFVKATGALSAALNEKSRLAAKGVKS